MKLVFVADSGAPRVDFLVPGVNFGAPGVNFRLQNDPGSSPGASPEPPEVLRELSGSLREHSGSLQKLSEVPKLADHEFF